MNKVKKIALWFTGAAITASFPLLALAQTPQTQNLFALVTSIKDILDLLIPIAVTLALLFFIWGLAQFILASGDEEKRSEGKRKMGWGIVALFVIVSIWGIVTWMQNVLGIQNIPDVGAPGVRKEIP